MTIYNAKTLTIKDVDQFVRRREQVVAIAPRTENLPFDVEPAKLSIVTVLNNGDELLSNFCVEAYNTYYYTRSAEVAIEYFNRVSQ